MENENKEMDEREIIEACSEFLHDSSDYYKDFVKRREDDMSAFSGDFWTQGRRNDWRRNKRRCEQINQWGVYENAIVSPYSQSPWHAELKGDKGAAQDAIQDAINAIENDADTKQMSRDALADAVRLGVGYLVVSTVKDEITGEPKVILETPQTASSVALDPNVITLSAKDAEEGAIVNYIGVKKARRLYGDDVLPLDFPRTSPLLSNFGDQWKPPENSVPIVSYYRKNESGRVVFCKICGNKVVQKDVELPISIIPIVRFCGYKVKRNQRTDYIGIVDKTFSIQLGLNLGYSTLLERMNRSPKANFVMPVEAIDGLEPYYERAGLDDSEVVLYKGSVAPTPIVESYATQDLSSTISESKEMMAAVIGVPSTGISGVDMQSKTATEVLLQQTNSESNVSNFYSSAYEAMRTVGRIIIQLVNDGKDFPFELENGPDVITRRMKQKQELLALANLVPDTMKPIIAAHYADTLDSSFADKIKADVVANLDPSLKLISGTDEDPNAVHVLKQMQATLGQTMQALDDEKKKSADLEEQVKQMMLSLANEREKNALDWNKFKIEQSNTMALEAAKLKVDGAATAADLQQNQQKLDFQAAQSLDKLQRQNDKMLGA